MSAPSLSEVIKDEEQYVQSLKKLLKEYPDATQDHLPDGETVWCSPSIQPTDLAVVSSAKTGVVLAAYATVGTIRVYAVRLSVRSISVRAMLSKLQKDHPAAYHALVRSVD